MLRVLPLSLLPAMASNRLLLEERCGWFMLMLVSRADDGDCGCRAK